MQLGTENETRGILAGEGGNSGGRGLRSNSSRASLVAQRLKLLPAMWETWV